jgi:Uma2 family endonuclease
MLRDVPRPPHVTHVRAPVPLHFPESAEMPESNAHLIVRTFLYQLLRYALGPGHTVGSDQFVYWVGNDPRQCLSPDVFVKVGVREELFGSWKCWLRGAPELAVEVISPNEGDGIAWGEKLARYGAMGVKELVRFDPHEPAGKRLRAWDSIDGDLVERLIHEERTPCVTLSLDWLVCAVDPLTEGLRLAREGGELVPTREETEVAARLDAEAGRVAAEARVRELEAQLRHRD